MVRKALQEVDHLRAQGPEPILWLTGIWKNTPDNQIERGFVFYGQENVATTWSFDGSFGVGMLGFWRFFWDLGG